MKNRHRDIILASFEISPKHRTHLLAALRGAADVYDAAQAVKKVCRQWSIGEFPNPFPYANLFHEVWKGGWNGVPRIPASTKPVPALTLVPKAAAAPKKAAAKKPASKGKGKTKPKALVRPNFEDRKYTKEKIEKWVIRNFGKANNIDTGKTKKADMIRRADELIKGKK